VRITKKERRRRRDTFVAVPSFVASYHPFRTRKGEGEASGQPEQREESEKKRKGKKRMVICHGSPLKHGRGGQRRRIYYNYQEE